MTPQQLFDRIVTSLGLPSGTSLAAELGKTKQTASYWRNRGFPRALHSDLQVLAARLGKPLPPEFYQMTGIPDPREHAREH